MIRTAPILAFVALTCLSFSGCQQVEQPLEAAPMHVTSDDHSFGNPSLVRVVHADLDWTLNFDARQLMGSVTWTVERSDITAPLILDTKGLSIEAVEVGDHRGLRPLPVTFGESHEAFGSSLVIPLHVGEDHVKITYHTAQGGGGLQWLLPEQTAGKKHPFLFSQAQSIMARSFLPCQDSPSVRFTYTARVRTREGLRPVMAAGMLPDRDADGAYRFEMPQPIPSYLLAIACGDLVKESVGPRTDVWAEPAVLSRAAYEFGDTERMIQAAEALYGPYQWERYDILVLPPSFPFGGMENPRLTFATPTILAGDRSLVALVAHELAHSWSGNLVTNATWSDFWLNEGFTVYFERRIMEAVYGKARAEMEALLGRQDLEEDLQELPAKDTQLKTDLKGRDPDEAFSNVPYEKGYLFLRAIEEIVGRERLDPFLKNWFSVNAFQSRTTEDFLGELGKLLSAEERTRLSIDQWVYQPGVPASEPRIVSDALTKVDAITRAYSEGALEAPEIETADWTYHHWLHFLRALPKDLSRNRMSDLDLVFRLTESGNSEILHQWLLIAIRTGYQPAMPALERFLGSMGRRKFLKPLYQELMKTDPDAARRIYTSARSSYHSMAQATLDDIVVPR